MADLPHGMIPVGAADTVSGRQNRFAGRFVNPLGFSLLTRLASHTSQTPGIQASHTPELPIKETPLELPRPATGDDMPGKEHNCSGVCLIARDL